MRLALFFKVFLLSTALSLLVFALSDAISLLTLAKMLAAGTVVSIGVGAFLPEVRGVQRGDTVSVITGNGLHSLMGRFGKAVTAGKRNAEIKVRFHNGEEAVGVIENYDGLVTPPRIRILYEEKLME